jgi:hypothetical protein
MSCIRLHAITIDSDDSTFIIENGTINITNTDISTSALNGCLVLDGGLGINCIDDASSNTSGGALTVGGGASIKGQTYLGNNVVLDSSLSTLTINGILYPRFFLDTINNKKLEVSLDGLNKHFTLTNSNLTIGITAESTSQTSAAMIVNGGISINCTSNAISVTNGGSLTVAGGASVKDDVYIGKSLYVGSSSSSNDVGIHTKNIISTDLTIVSDNDINVTCGNMLLTNNHFVIGNDTYGDYISFNGSSSSFMNTVTLYNTSGSGSLVCNGQITVNCTSGDALTVLGGGFIYKELFVGGDIQCDDTLYLGNGSNATSSSLRTITSGSLIFTSSDNFIFNNGVVYVSSGSLHLNEYTLTSTDGSLNVQSTSDNAILNLLTSNNDGLDDNYIYIHGYIQNNNADTEYLRLGYNSIDENYNLLVNKTGNGILRNFVIGNTYGSVTLQSNGSVLVSSLTSSLNSTSASLLLEGGLSIKCTSNATSLTCGGSLTINGGASISKNVYIGGDLNLSSNSSSGNLNIVSKLNINSTNDPSLVISKNNVNDTSANSINISFYTLGNETGTGGGVNYEKLQISGSSGSNGININTAAGGNGKIRYLNLCTGTSANQLFLDTTGNIGINTSTPGYSLDVNGVIKSNNTILSNNLKVTNDITTNNLIINNDLHVSNDTYISGSLYEYNTVTFYNTTNSLSSNSGGSLNIYGGAGIRKNLYIGGCLYSESNGSFNTINVTSYSDNSLSLTGGIVINSTKDATGTNNGGSLTVRGGASINKKLYINDHSYFNNTIHINNTNDIFKIYDQFNILRYGFIYDGVNNLSINRYDSLGSSIENMITFNNTTGYTTFNNTTGSINGSTCSVIISGGLNINTTRNATNVSVGGALTISGGASINKDLFIGGDIHIVSTTASNNINSGSLIVKGGVGVSGNMNIDGNTIINGSLTVNGSTTAVDTTNAIVNDNIMVLNSGPTGTHDSGILIGRYQTSNNSGSGDVVTDNPYIIDVLASQSGISSPSNTIKLSYLTSNSDNYYNNWWIKVETGFSTNQCRQIISYDGTTHVATLDSSWTTQNPANGDTVYLYNKPFVGIIYNEILNVFEFGSTTQDPGKTNVSFTDTIGISFNSGVCNNTTPSTNVSSGALLLSGGLSINCTTDASSNTNGGCLTIAGGASIRKSLYVGNSLNVNNVNITPNSYDIISSITYNALNNQLDIPFITINNNVWSFDIYLAVFIGMSDPNDNLYCNFNIRGVNKHGAWEIITNYVGDDTGIEFDIVNDILTNDGILRYSTPDYGVQLSNVTFKYRMVTN